MSANLRDDDDIRMIRDSAAAVAPRGGDLKRIRALRFKSPGFDRAVWSEMCALGWTGLLAPEDAGGAGLGLRAFCALAEELGAGLVPEPLIEGALAARFLSEEALAALLSGARLVLPAWQERTGQFSPEIPEARFQNGRVEGKKLFIPAASAADAFVVTTRDGAALVERSAAGAHLDISATQDGGEFGTLSLDGAPAAPLAASVSVADAFDEAALGTAAYLLGMMERVFEITLDYLRTRQQFGKTIGGFQALQHKAADLKIQIALTRASVESAAASVDGRAPVAARRAAVSRAKARASDAAMLVTRQAVQLHGGIGYTDEYDAGLYLRKAMVVAGMYGSAATHRARFSAMAADEAE